MTDPTNTRPVAPTRTAFPTTLWSRVREVGRPPHGPAETVDSERRTAQEALFAAYWPPVYGYIRRKLAADHQRAADLTQDFFVHVLESELLAKATPARGRFRTFLKSCLEHHLIDDHRRMTARKRGGHLHRISDDDAMRIAEDRGLAELLAEPSTGPADVLDELWRRQLVEGALAQVEQELRAEGRDVCWSVFAAYFLDDASTDYAALAARYGVKPHDVSNHLRRAKQRYRARLESMVMETVHDAGQLEEELAWLFGRESNR
ncbi:MAG: sigma-70 family RNA polymerase sigma factor [Planctomycetes bacterium]|nr:sigma-70 family RNA polymerase sigma factor [Planctomycetota bacterium]MCB9870901.1 sigma-70 family RNA polymerase sigma factor [Planctomycetota bacterium]